MVEKLGTPPQNISFCSIAALPILRWGCIASWLMG